jgi:hypothetical protein
MPRKKSKNQVHGSNPNQASASVDPPVATSEPSAREEIRSDPAQNASTTTGPSTPSNTASDIVDLRKGWYGSWKQKAKPVAEVAKESVTAANGSPARMPRTPSVQDNAEAPSPKRYLSSSSNQSTKGTPLAATTTNLSISSSANPKVKLPTDPANLDERKDSAAVMEPPNPPLPPDPSGSNSSEPTTKTPKPPIRPVSSSGWFGGWWSRPDNFEEAKNPITLKKEDSTFEEARNKPLPATTPSESPEQSKHLPQNPIEIPQNGSAKLNADADQVISNSYDSRSWFWTWSRAQDPRPSILRPDEPRIANGSAKDSTTPKALAVKTVTAEELAPKAGSMKDGQDSKAAKKSSGWAFWSRETDEPESNMEGSIHKHVGEIAVANTPSQSHPEAAQFNMVEEAPQKEPPRPVTKKGRGRPPKVKDESAASTPSKATPQPSPSRKEVDPLTKQPVMKADRTKENLLLPEFNKTFSILQKPSIWQNIKDYLTGTETHDAHLHLLEKPPRVKKALAIGIHGFFPPGIVQKLLGAPTGTSIKFSGHAAAAIKAWTEKYGYECEIEKVALEGEGLIADRVEMLWKLLLNWIDHVRSADLILLACHSQGVPVTIMLVERLIRFKCINPHTRIGICSMAGVNLGPFEVYRTKWLGSAGFELFEFANASSKVSKDYLSALEEVLKHGVKVVYIGSLDDQLVSLEVSAAFERNGL